MDRAIIHFSKIAALGILLVSSAAGPSLAITPELAKKCRLMAIKAYPTQRAGTKSQFAEKQRAYFDECIRKGGKMETPH